MSTGKKEVKAALMLTPSAIEGTHVIFELLLIHKDAKSISYDAKPLDRARIKDFAGPPAAVKEILFGFTRESVDKQLQLAKLRLKEQRAGVGEAAYLANAIKRYLRTQFDSLKPLSGLLKWYHKMPSANGKHVRIAPCAFSNYRPQLSFEVVPQNESWQLLVHVGLNGSHYPLSSFTRHVFLLESNNEYFLLAYKDVQTLDWLQSTVETSTRDALLFQEKILARLEVDYTVNRNNLFTAGVISSLPVNRLMLTELNNSFLVLTPQWLYDGLLTEGSFTEKEEHTINGEVWQIQRNRDAEESFLRQLVVLHPNFANQRNGYYYLSFADAQKKQWFLKAWYQLLDTGTEIIGMDMLQHFRYSPHKPQTTLVEIKEEGSFAVIEMKVMFGDEKIPVGTLQKTLLSGARALMLKDGSLGVLSDEWLKDYAVFIKHGKIDKDQVTVSKFLAISERNVFSEVQRQAPLVTDGWWKKWMHWQQQNEVLYPLPSLVQAQLRPYQQKGFEWLALLCDAGAGGCLADDMGLGKTLQAICFLAHYIQQHPSSLNIIVCPSSLIYNWQNELQKFAPAIPVIVYHGASRKEMAMEGSLTGILITSYGTLRSDADALCAAEYGVAILDESHYIRNPSAQVTVAVQPLKAAMRVALSGTPVVNNSLDLYSQLNFTLPGMFGSKEFFRKEYADAIDRYRDEDKIAALNKLTAPFILRRTKEQVAKDLPERTESILWCTMENDQQLLYNNIQDQVRSSIFTGIKNEGLQKSKLAVLQGMLKLRQVCNSALLLPADERQLCSESVKTKVLMAELLHIGTGHKALVFSQFSSMLHLLAAQCAKDGVSFYHFDGSTPPAKRAEMVRAFQDEKDTVKVFLISLKAGNTGLTLTAADYVFLFDPWWNTATEQQAIDRTHRIGQIKNVFAYKMICRNTIEEKIIQLQEKKKILSDSLISQEEGFVKSLSEEDIAYLFS